MHTRAVFIKFTYLLVLVITSFGQCNGSEYILPLRNLTVNINRFHLLQLCTRINEEELLSGTNLRFQLYQYNLEFLITEVGR
jgi:hypothetical protein